MQSPARRIAMWSGPRNISTAMMRSWENRADTVVCDEPFYAYYLAETGLEHPGREAVLSDQSQDWREVARQLTGPIPDGATIYYQKHMSHHLLPGIERDWMADLDHVLLIRRPLEMLASLDAKLEAPTLDDTGLPQQIALADWLTQRNGEHPLVLDSRDVLENPASMLRTLCERLHVPFDPAMLAWPAGPRDSDGIWADHWYENVWNSTGFQPYRQRDIELDPRLIPICEACDGLYEQLYAQRLTVNS